MPLPDASNPAFRRLVKQESRRIFFSQLKARWVFSLLLACALALAWLLDRPQFGSGHGVWLLAVFILFNALLQWCGVHGREGSWTIFATPLVDHALISLHLIISTQILGPTRVVWAPENSIFLIISFYTALRLDYRGLVFSLALNCLALNLVFYFSRVGLDPALLVRLPEMGLDGHLIRLIIFLTLGGFFYLIPLVFRHLLAKNEALFQSRQALREIQRQDLERAVAEKTSALQQTNQDLRTALQEVQALEALLPLCSRCKKIKDDSGRWLEMEQYLARRPQVRVTHGLCEQCFAILYPEIAEEVIIQLRELEAKEK